MTPEEVKETVDSLRELADWLETNDKADDLPYLDMYFVNYIYEYAKDETGMIDYSSTDDFETRLKMRDITKALGTCKKNYIGDNFQVTKKFGKATWTFQTSRKAICRKVVVETKEVPEELVPAYVKPARVEEVVEWVCDDPLLKASQ